MFGKHHGSLNLYINPPVTGRKKPVFSMKGQQGKLWVKAEVTLNSTSALVSILLSLCCQ